MTQDDPRIDVNELMKELPDHCHDIELISRGKRGVIFKASSRGREVAIKMAHPSSKAHNAILHEARSLERVNKLGLGPELIESDESYVMMEYVPGRLIGELFSDKTVTADTMRTVLKSVIDQLCTLDKNGINKQELTNPYKHIIIKEDFEPVLIDFERARITLRPSNLTQFSQYLTGSAITVELDAKGILPEKERFYKLMREYHQAGAEEKEAMKEAIKSLL